MSCFQDPSPLSSTSELLCFCRGGPQQSPCNPTHLVTLHTIAFTAADLPPVIHLVVACSAAAPELCLASVDCGLHFGEPRADGGLQEYPTATTQHSTELSLNWLLLAPAALAGWSCAASTGVPGRLPNRWTARVGCMSNSAVLGLSDNPGSDPDTVVFN